MRTTAAVLALCLVMTSSCGYASSRRTAKIGVGLIVVGAVAVATAHAVASDSPCPLFNDDEGELSCLLYVMGFGGLASGVVVSTIGLIGAAIFNDPTYDTKAVAHEEAEAAREAPPPGPPPDPECLKLRAERLRAANTIVDPRARAEALRSIPVCEAPPT